MPGRLPYRFVRYGSVSMIGWVRFTQADFTLYPRYHKKPAARMFAHSLGGSMMYS